MKSSTAGHGRASNEGNLRGPKIKNVHTTALDNRQTRTPLFCGVHSKISNGLDAIKPFRRREISRNSDLRKDWKQIAADAWLSPSWREAAIEYHRDRPPTPRQSPNKLTPLPRDIWRAAGQCVRRKAPHDALRTFLKWCDYSGVERSAGMPIFKTIVEKELAK